MEVGTLSLSVGVSQQKVVNIIKQTPELNKYWVNQTEPQKDYLFTQQIN